MAEIGKDIQKALDFLDKGELIAIPTETVYGLAANAFDPMAVAEIFKVKQRPTFDPLIVHVNSLEQANSIVTDIHPDLLKLANAFWPGPLTLLLPKRDIVPDIVTSGLNRVGVRVPNHPLTLELLNKLSFPLAAPSANPFGYISPTTALHVQAQLGDLIPYILDGGSSQVGLESTIVGEEEGEIIVYRLGGLSIEQIEFVVGKVTLQINHSSNPKVPGQLKSHYAPKKPIIIGNIPDLINQHRNKNIGILTFGKTATIYQNQLIKNLSPSENLTEAAVNLFSFLRELDNSDVHLIITDYVPNNGLGLAINDRLQRAAFSK